MTEFATEPTAQREATAAVTRESRIPGSPPLRAVVGLALGLAVGLVIDASGSSTARSVATSLEPIGMLWVNAIRMTVIPLVFSLVIATIVSAGDARAVGRTGGKAIAAFAGLLGLVALLTALLAPAVFALFDVDFGNTASLRASVQTTAAPAQIPGFGRWLVSLVPDNPIRAAADGAMLPLLVFAVLFALALVHAPPAVQTPAKEIFRGISDTMLVIVRWVLALAPIGVFALAVTIATHLGTAVAGAVGFYLLAHCGVLAAAGLLMYVVAFVVGGVSPGRFARAVLPAQVVAVSTRSSMAALPAMVQGAERVLRAPAQIVSFVLPLGISVFRLNQPVSWVVCAAFVAKLYGVDLGVREVALLAVASIPMSFSVPGIPSGGLFVMAPFFPMVGLPIEGIGILIALDAIPDLFKTTLNVTGQMTATAVLSRAAKNEQT
jgi:proton glutamate symport protein